MQKDTSYKMLTMYKMTLAQK